MSELLASLGIDALEHPGWLLALLVLAALALARAERRVLPALDWPALPAARTAGARRFDALRGASLLLRAAVLAALALAVAGPLSLASGARRSQQGLDLLLALDASGSMRALDTQVGDEWRTRLELAREAVSRFAERRAAEGDRVGLVVFGAHAFTQCPLTHDGRLLAAALSRVEAGVAGEATALGDALALSVKRLGGGEPAPGAPLAGRVVVLLTDGRSNSGAVPPDVAAGLAAARGIRVHTVGIGGEEEVPMAGAGEGAPRGVRYERHALDAPTLEQIAATTGGRFFHAQRSGDLAQVYAAIDALERVPREAPPFGRRNARPEPWLALAGTLLLVEIAGARGLGRRLP